MAFGHLADRSIRSRGKAEIFDGRQSPHPAAADLFHSLLSVAGSYTSFVRPGTAKDDAGSAESQARFLGNRSSCDSLATKSQVTRRPL